jgi:endonuclease-3
MLKDAKPPAEKPLEDPPEARVAEVTCLLRDEHAIRPQEPSGLPVDELVAAVLSQHTSDQNSHRAFAALKLRYPRWSQVAAADAAGVAETIRCGGLADQKAPRIIQMLRQLPTDEAGEPTLGHLAAMHPQEAHEYLTALDGVGPKTAACALLFAYGMPTFPVDTHVHRVTRRIGWAAEKDTAEAVFRTLSRCVRPEHTYDLHVGLVLHGRRVCRPHSPRCNACVLQDQCEYREKTAGRRGEVL